MRYKVEKSAYYLAKLKYALNNELIVSNEFYLFYKGLFAEKIDPKGQSFRNILRMTFHL